MKGLSVFWGVRPFGGRESLHREGMYLVGTHSLTQRGVNPLMALDQALAFEFGGDHHGAPVAAVAGHFEMFAGKARGDEGLKFFGCHQVSDRPPLGGWGPLGGQSSGEAANVGVFMS